MWFYTYFKSDKLTIKKDENTITKHIINMFLNKNKVFIMAFVSWLLMPINKEAAL